MSRPTAQPSIDRLLFIASSALPGPEERSAFLEFACNGDQKRIKRLETLLDIRGDAEEFFELQPAITTGSPNTDDGDLGARIGPYNIIDRLGSGGCGVVYLAEKLEPLKRKVALKIIRLATDVRRFLKEEAILARPPSRRYLIAKWIRRNRITFAAASIALSGLLGGLGLSTWLFLSERDARQVQAHLRVEAERARANEVRLLETTRASEFIAQAGVLLRYKEVEKADALIAGIKPGLVPPSLEAINTLQTVAEWNLLNGRWQAAAERYLVLVPVITSVDISDTDEMSRLLMPAAAAIKRWGKAGAYQDLRNLTLRRFGDSTNPAVAAQAIKVAMLEPTDEITFRALAPLLQRLQNYLDSPPANESHYIIPWRRFTLALYRYRAGELDAALKHTKTNLSLPLNSPPLIASSHLLLAMIESRQGRHEEARAAFDQAQKLIEAWEAAPYSLGVSVDLWFDWENSRFLRDEALQIMGGS